MKIRDLLNPRAMLRSSARYFTAIRGFHTSLTSFAKPVAPAKKAVHGYKKTSSGKVKKTSGAGKFFNEYVTGLKLEKKAQEIPGLAVLEKEIKENTVVKYTQLQMKKLVISGSFKNNQFRELFQTPITLVTKDTKHMQSFVKKASTSNSKNNRICLLGENGIGKTSLLGQTQALISNLGDSVIIPIPHATQLVNGRNDFTLDQQTKLYTQPMFLKRFLDKILRVNDKILTKIPIKNEYSFEGNTRHKSQVKATPNRHTLYDLVKLSVAPRYRGKQFDAIIYELTEQDKVPVFLTVDHFNSLTSDFQTAYRDTENRSVHVEKFQIGKLIFEFASGAKFFKKGGVILVTSTDAKTTDTLNAGLGLSEPDPYTPEHRWDRELSEKLKGVKPYQLHKFSKENVSTLVEKFIDADIFKTSDLQGNTFENLVSQKYILSGNGNPGELIKSIVMGIA